MGSSSGSGSASGSAQSPSDIGRDAAAAAAEAGSIAGIQDKLRRILGAFDGAFAEREPHVRHVLLAILSGNHALLLGPPGTAKSMLARAMHQVFADATWFEYLLTRFTHPDELFGPVSIPGLKEEDYRRLTDGYLPRADVAFIDEIFKANSAILNSLLAIINERIFHHGRHRDRVPLLGLVGASNEPPDPQGGLGALFDRFLVRLSVMPVVEDAAFTDVILGRLEPLRLPADDRLTRADLALIARAAEAVEVPDPIESALVSLRDLLNEGGIHPSERRWRQAVMLMRTAAATTGRSRLIPSDLLLLEHCFGRPGDQEGSVRAALRRCLQPLVAGHLGGGDLAAAWGDLARDDYGPRDDEARGFRSALGDRLGRLADFEGLLREREQALDRGRMSAAEEAEASIWHVGVPMPLVASFIRARRDVDRYRQGAARWRHKLAALDLYQQVVPRAQRNQLSTMGHEALVHFDGRLPPVWVSAPGAAPESWVPLSREGLLLSDQRVSIAGTVHRRLIESAMAEGRPVDQAGGGGGGLWHRAVRHLTLDNDLLFAVLSPPELGPRALVDVLDGRVDWEWTEEARQAIRGLVEWLRGVGLRAVPGPPIVSAQGLSDDRTDGY